MNFMTFPSYWEWESSQLTIRPSFFRRVGLNHQPVVIDRVYKPTNITPSPHRMNISGICFHHFKGVFRMILWGLHGTLWAIWIHGRYAKVADFPEMICEFWVWTGVSPFFLRWYYGIFVVHGIANNLQELGLPFGKITVCYWTLPFIIDLPIKNGDVPYWS